MQLADAKTLAELAGTLISGTAAVYALLRGRRNTREIEGLRAELAERQAERDARRDYEYEARKRLYGDCEPLFFQLAEAADSAVRRIRNLALVARAGNLQVGPGGWLSHGRGYYMASSAYRLFRPVTIVRLLQDRLTTVDLSLDAQVDTQYRLAKALYWSFSDDHELAAIEPSLSYDPDATGALRLRRDLPAEYWRQGLPAGRLDTIVEALIVRQDGGAARVTTYGEFEKAFGSSGDGSLGEDADVLAQLLTDFHPRTRPVLWRILIAQLHIYEGLLRVREARQSAQSLAKPLAPVRGGGRRALDWRQQKSEAPEVESLEAPFVAAETYLRARLGELWDPGVPSPGAQQSPPPV